MDAMKIPRHNSSFLLIFLFLLALFWGSHREECWAENPRVEAKLEQPKIEIQPGSATGFTIRVIVPKEHHAYLDRGDKGFFIPIEFDFAELTAGGYQVKTVKKPEGEREDKLEATVLRGEGVFEFQLEAVSSSPPGKTYQVDLRSQICNDITNICYPPDSTSISLPVHFGVKEEKAPAPAPKTSATVSSPPPVEIPSQDGEGLTGWLLAKYREYSKNILIAFVFMILAGILSAATPCVYPMLPITSAILMQRGGGSKEEGVRHSMLYFVGIILVYMAMGYAAGMTGGALSMIMRSATVNLLFALFFALFALSMLGFYDFSFGEDFTAKLDSSVSKKAGYSGTLLMGVVAGLVVSPCVGPVVFALLLQVADRIAELSSQMLAAGQEPSLIQKSLIAGRGGILMGGFGIGIGIPFLLVGLYSNKMPRAGTWMVYVKYLLGLVILYFAFLYYMKGMGVARVKPEAAYGILVGLVSIFASVYLGLFKSWSEETTTNEKLKKACAVILVLFGVYFFYSGLSRSGLLLGVNQAGHEGGAGRTVGGEEMEIHGNLAWHRDFEKAKAVAAKENRPIFLDFYADWCANCIEFQKLSLSNEELNQALQKAVLMKIYDTDPIFKTFQEDPKYPELKTGLPFFAILKSNGEFFWKGTQYDAVKTMKRMIESAF